MRFFSASTIGFYDSESIKSAPSDLVDITDDTWLFLLKGQEKGGIISADENGYPVLTVKDTPQLTQQELIAQAEQKKEALRAAADKEIFWRQDAVDTGLATEEETVALSEWKKYRVLLMRVDTAAPVWPPVPGEQATKNSV